MISRRRLIGTMGGGAILSAVAMPDGLFAAVRPPFRAVCDRRLEGGRSLHDAARAAGCAVADPQGEMVRLFHGDCAAWLASDVPVVGYTSWADYHMMGELARSAGRRMTQGAIVGRNRDSRELVLGRGNRLTLRMRGLLDSSCADCAQGGIAWIVES